MCIPEHCQRMQGGTPPPKLLFHEPAPRGMAQMMDLEI
jgi:hypothetical protein